jgi:hypothetical protein
MGEGTRSVQRHGEKKKGKKSRRRSPHYARTVLSTSTLPWASLMRTRPLAYCVSWRPSAYTILVVPSG